MGRIVRGGKKHQHGQGDTEAPHQDVGAPPPEAGAGMVGEHTDQRVRDCIEETRGQEDIAHYGDVDAHHVAVELGDVDIDRNAHHGQGKSRQAIGEFVGPGDAVCRHRTPSRLSRNPSSMGAGPSQMANTAVAKSSPAIFPRGTSFRDNSVPRPGR